MKLSYLYLSLALATAACGGIGGSDAQGNSEHTGMGSHDAGTHHTSTTLPPSSSSGSSGSSSGSSSGLTSTGDDGGSSSGVVSSGDDGGADGGNSSGSSSGAGSSSGSSGASDDGGSSSGASGDDGGATSSGSSSGATGDDGGGSSSGVSSSSSSGAGSSSGSTSSSSGGDDASGSSSGAGSSGGSSGSSSGGSSGAGDSGAVCTAPTCVYTQGYYKNHPASWTVLPVVMGSQSYDETACMALLNNPSTGDASVILAKQYIAAVENQGLCDPNASAALAAASAWFTANQSGALPYGVMLPMSGCASDTTSVPCQAYWLGQSLDSYNTGLRGTPHCL